MTKDQLQQMAEFKPLGTSATTHRGGDPHGAGRQQHLGTGPLIETR